MMEFYKVLEKIMKNKDLTIPEVARLCNIKIFLCQNKLYFFLLIFMLSPLPHSF